MQFSTIRALVAWAFQMSEAVPVKSAKYGESTGPSFGQMSPAELKDMAADILVKVSRLPWAEQCAITAYCAGSTKACNEIADHLPAPWPTALKRELARGWANDQVLERDQKQMADTFYLSEATMTRRKKEAFGVFALLMDRGLAVLEVQLLSLVRHRTRRNEKCRASACLAA